MFLSTIIAHRATAGVIYVKDNNAASGQNGSSWTLAYADLGPALEQAEPGDSIFVSEGIYEVQQDAPGCLYNSFRVPDGINIFGSLLGNENPSYDMSLRDFVSNASYLSGENDVDAVLVSVATAATNETVIDGFRFVNATRAAVIHRAEFTFRNCDFNGFICSGGVVEARESLTAFERCRFRNNHVENWGAVLYLSSGSTALEACRIDSNSSDGYKVFGGSVLQVVDSAFASFTNCAFYKNTCTNTDTMPGLSLGSELNLVNCSFSATLVDSSGAPEVFSSAVVQNSSLYDNDLIEHLKSTTDAGNLSLEYSIVPSGAYSGTSLITTNPNLAAYTLEIQNTSSSAYNAGNSSLNSTTYDLVGHQRIFSTSIDIGAYEYCGGSCKQSEEEKLPVTVAVGLYPNPTNGRVTVHTDRSITSIRIYNSLGQMAWSQRYTKEDNFFAELDFHNYAAGYYIVEVSTGNESSLEKLIVQ